jgi:inner membrane protein
MDPITHGLLGGIVAQAAVKRKNIRAATAVGFFAAVLPDLDLLIRTSSDPLASVSYHRHFSHALAFIPIGGFIAAVLYWLLRRRRVPFGVAAWAALVGYGTHGLLDAFTSYGTVLLWPFSEYRVSWDAIPIVYPLYTLLLGAGLVGAYKLGAKWPSWAALVLTVLFIGGGWLQRDRALEAQRDLAVERGHLRERGRVLPAINSLTLWRSLYEAGGLIHVDAIRVAPFREVAHRPGGSLAKVDLEEFAGAAENTVAQKALLRYNWFADGYLSWISRDPPVMGDARFAVVPNGLSPLWGIEISPETGEVKKQRFERFTTERIRAWWRILWEGYADDYNP